MTTANLTADAIIAKERWRDDFNRVVGGSDPYAATDWGPEWTVTSVSTGGTTWVDGSVVRVSANESVYATPASPESKRVSYGFVQFDFWVPADTSDYRSYFWVTQGGEYPVGIEAYQDSATEWMVTCYHYYASFDAMAAFTPEPSTWYRVKGVFNGVRGGILAVKVWKASDPEPSEFAAVGSIDVDQTPLSDPDDWYDLTVYFAGTTAEAGGFDNLVYGDYGDPFSISVYQTVSAGAVIRWIPGIKTSQIDAEIAPRRFTAGAWIIGGRSGHSRFYDHYGTEPDTVVVLDGAIEKYASGTTVHVVLADLINRVTALESGNHVMMLFAAGAWIQPYLRASAVIFKTMTYDLFWERDLGLTANAVLVRGKTDQMISVNAVIIRVPETTFFASAYLIDLVC